MTLDLFPTAWSAFAATIVFLLGAVVGLKIGPALGVRQKRALGLYLWHSVFCCVYIYYVLTKGGDAIMYFQTSFRADIGAALGTEAVRAFTSVLTQGLGLSFLGVFLVFNVFGYIGLLAFAGTVRSAVRNKSWRLRRFAAFVVFLPSMSFWSAAIGKDAISFMAAGLAVWASQAISRRAPLMAVAIVLMLAVRPHIAAMLVASLAVGMLFQRGVGVMPRLLVGGLAIAASAFAIPLAMEESKLGSGAGTAEVYQYIEGRQGYNMEGGGGVDISSMPLPLQVLTYLFRPLPIEAHNVPALASSIDNVVLLVVVWLALYGMARGYRAELVKGTPFLLFYTLTVCLMLSMTTANLGISMRQKWMFVPMLLLLAIPLMGKTKGSKSEAST